jgi:hypothetical protein
MGRSPLHQRAHYQAWSKPVQNAPRRARILRIAVTVPLSVAAVAATSVAHADTVISPPTISAPLGGIGPYVTGTPVTFTFTAGPNAPAVRFEYELDGAALKKVKAANGTASVSITPTRRTSYLYVYGVAADGTVSGSAVDIFYADAAEPAIADDMTGDGIADLLTVGGTAGLAPGLWLGTGKAKDHGATGTGHVKLPMTDIGINGSGVNIPGSPSDFDGAEVITGQFLGDGFQDVIVYYPSGQYGSGGMAISGSGDGSALIPISGNTLLLPQGFLADANGDNPLQIANAYASIYGSGSDLIGVNGAPTNGYHLDYITGADPSAYASTFSFTTPTPDGTQDWNDWTIATTQVASGAAMFLWNSSTGALYLWSGLAATDNGDGTGNLAFTQYLISADWNTGTALSTPEAADINGDGIPDLWTVTPAGVATSYLVSQLSTTSSAVIRARPSQSLSTS